MDFKEARRVSRSSQLAPGRGKEAMADAGLSGGFATPERVGVVLGTAIAD